MKTIKLPLADRRGYDIHINAPLAGLGRALKDFHFSPQALVVSAAPIARRHAAPLMKSLKAAGFNAHLALMRDGERHKNFDALRGLYKSCLAARLDRKSPLIALGGGVVGDVAGFAAATYMRGVPLVQCPTTLLAMVDSSIGGKVAVDLPEGKNLVGAFCQPRLVWADLAVLKTLPDREWRTGAAEIIKYGLLGDGEIISIMESADLARLKNDQRLLENVVARSAAAKAKVVSQDERETKGLREFLNLGHTFGHAIEAVTGYKTYTHGEAIAVGMCAAARLSARLKILPFAYVRRLEGVFSRWGLPTRVGRSLPRAKILDAMSRDKKTLAGRFRFVIPVRWGQVKVVKDVPRAVLNRVLMEVGI